MVMDLLMLTGGLVLLAVAGEALVRSAGSLARLAGLSALVAGTLIVGPGTSMPEFVVSGLAALEGRSDLALGNVIGSNISNSSLILGSAALLLPMLIHRQALIREGLSLLVVTLVAIGMMGSGQIGRWEGLVLLGLLAAWLTWTLIGERHNQTEQGAMLAAEAELVIGRPWRWLPATLILVLSLGGLAAGATLTVQGAIGLARTAGLSEAFIGLTVVAVGTSLPEWSVTLIAALRRQADVAVGNILGSNLFNLTAILGGSAVINPLTVNPIMITSERWLLLGATIVLLIFLVTGQRLNRWEGATLVAAWIGWVVWLL